MEDKLFKAAGQLDENTVLALTDEISASDISNSNTRHIVRKKAFIPVLTVCIALLLVPAVIASGIIIQRYFPTLGVIDANYAVIRELESPVYLVNLESYNVEIEYAVFASSGDGRGTLYMEYSPDMLRYDDFYANTSWFDIPRADEYYITPEYSFAPSDSDTANDNTVVEAEDVTFSKTRIKYVQRAVQINDIEESEYYTFTFSNGKTALLHMPLSDNVQEPLWTNDLNGFKLRVTPYSAPEQMRYGIEVFPTKKWNDVTKLSVELLDPVLELSSVQNIYDDVYTPFIVGSFSRLMTQQQQDDLFNGFESDQTSHTYKSVDGTTYNGYNSFSYRFYEDWCKLRSNFLNTKKWDLDENNVYIWRDEYFTEDDFVPQRLKVSCIAIAAYFDDVKAQRHKITLPKGDGEITQEQIITDKHGLTYYINSIKREGTNVTIDLETDWSRRLTEKTNLYNNEHTANNNRVLSFAKFNIDGGYNVSEHFPERGSPMRHPVLTIEGVDEDTKSLNIYVTAVNFSQYGNYSVEIQ